MNTFRELKVWQKAHNVVLIIYKITKNFPAEEKFGLISQLRRAIVSVPTNITEGFKKTVEKNY
jgi:four helix bundle protein